jgi:hypothetical protein
MCKFLINFEKKSDDQFLRKDLTQSFENKKHTFMLNELKLKFKQTL